MIFTIIPKNQRSFERIGDMLATEFPRDFLAIDMNCYLLSSPGVAKEIAEKIGVSAQGGSSGIILAVSSYWGRSSPAVWDWLKEKLEGAPDA